MVDSPDIELSAQQKLNNMLSVFSNLSLNHNVGPVDSDFRGYVSKRINAGFTLTKGPIKFNANFYYVGKVRGGTNGIASDGWSWTLAKPRVDAGLDCRLTKRTSLFISGRNIFDDRDKTETYGTPTPAYARYNIESDYGVLFQLGVRGNF